MSQQNIDFGTFPDDPAADAIRTAFNKVQNNFDQLFGANANATVTSINRTPGAGITVNYPTGNVVVSANIACVQVSTSSLSIGKGSNGSSSAVITSSTQTLVVDINPDQVYSNYFADINNGLANFNGVLTVDSNAQPNVTTLGNLTSLNVVGNASFTGSNVYISNISHFKLMGGSAGNTIVTDGLGNLTWAAGGGGSGGAGGLDTQVQFNNNYALYGSNSFTWNDVANLLTVSPGNIITDSINANYFFGTLANGDSNVFVDANSNINFTANNVTTMVITRLGANIDGYANITGNANVGNMGATNIVVDTSANIPIIQQGNSNITITSNSNVTTYVNGNATARFTVSDNGIVANGTANVSGAITAGGNISTYGANGTVRANNITILGAATGNANVSSVTGNFGLSALAATYTDNSAAASATIANAAIHTIDQPTLAAANTSVTFTNAATLYVANAPAAGSNATITNPYSLYIANGSTYFGGANNFILGNLTVQGNATYYNVDSFTVEDPIISLGGGPNGNALTTNDGKDRGTALQYYTTAPVTAFMGWDNSNGEFAFGSNVTISSEVVTYNNLGNVRGLTWLGNVDGVYANFTGNITTTGNANLGNTATANYFVGRFYGTANAAIIANTVVDNAQPNITSVGTLTSLNVTGNTTSNNFIGRLANGNSNISILADSNINFNPIGSSNILVVTGLGINVAGTGNFTGNLSATAHYGPLANGNSNVYIDTPNGNITLTAVGNTTMTVTGTGANISGTANVSGNANVGNLGTVTAVITTGNIGTINSGLMQNGTSNLSIASGANVTLAVASTARLIATSAGANVVGTLNVSANANTGNLGTTTAVITTGNISTINTGLIQNGNSNIVITPNSNLTFTAKSNSTMVISDTGANITGTANVTGNANVGNLGASQVLASANVTSPQLISNVATGTAPLSVQSTTRVANLSVSYANVADYGVVTTQTTGTFYPVFVNANTTGNYAHASNANLSFNAATGNLSTTLLNVTSNANTGNLGTGTLVATTGNITTINSGLMKNASSNIAITADANITLTANANSTLVVTSTGANVTGYSNVTGNLTAGNVIGTIAAGSNTITTTGNANVGNLGFGTGVITGTGNITAGNFIGNGASLSSLTGANVTGAVPYATTANTVAGANVTGAVSYATIANGVAGANVSGNVSSANVAYYANVTTQTSGTYYPIFASGNTTSNYALASNTLISANLANGAVIATTFVGNILGNIGGILANGNSNVSIPASNGNVNITAVGNTTFVVTGTGVNVAGTLNATGNANVNNLGTAQVLASANVTSPQLISNVATGTAPLVVTSTTQVANLNVATAGLATFATTANAVAGANVSGQVANALVAGTVYTNAQPNITSVGTLTGLTVGNATANAIFGNGTVTLTSAGSVTGGNLLSATYLTGTLTTAAQPNITSVGTLTSLGVSGTITAANITANTGVFTGNGNGLSSIVGANVTGQVANALVAGTVYTNAQPNITSVGTLTSLGVSGTITAANITANTGVFTGNGNGLSSIVGANVTGTVGSATNAAALLQNTSTATTVYPTFTASSANGNSSAVINTSISANLGNASITATTFVGALSGAATTAGTVTTAAQPNITSVGTLTSLGVNGTVTAVAFTANTGVFTGNANGLSSIVGANVTGTVGSATNAAALLQNTSTSTTVYPTFTTSSANGNSSAVINTSISANLGNASITATTFVGALSGAATTAGTVTTAAQPNITSTGTLTSITTSGNLTFNTTGQRIFGEFSNATHISRTLFQSITTNGNTFVGVIPNGTGTLGQLNLYNRSDAGNASALQVIAGNVETSIRAENIGTGSYLPITVYTGGSERMRFDTSGNVGIGNAAPTNTLSITGTAYVSGNANVGNLGTAGQIVSSIATGTAPFVVTSTTQVANLSVATAGSATTAGTVTTAAQPNITSVGTLTSVTTSGNLSFNSTGQRILGDFSNTTHTSRTLFQNITTNANTIVGIIPNGTGTLGQLNAYNNSDAGNSSILTMLALSTETSIRSGNVGTGAYLPTTFYTGGSERMRIDSNGNVGIGNTAPTNTLSVTGTAYVSGNVTAGNISATNHTGTTSNITGQYITTVATGTAPFVVTSTTQVANLSVATAGSATSATTAGTVTTAAQPNITSTGTLTGLTVTANSGVATPVTINDTSPAAGSSKSFVIGGGSQQLAFVANITNGSYNSLQTTGDMALVATGAAIGNVGFSIVPWASATSGIRISSVSNVASITLAANTVTSTGYIVRSVGTAISAAGTTQGTATAIAKEINVVSTVLTGNGVILPAPVAGMVITITNTSANSLLVYPQTNGIINALAANAAFTHPTLATLQYIAPTTTQWYTVGATYA